QAQVMSETVSGVGKDLIIVCADDLHIAGRNPTIPVFPGRVTVVVRRNCFSDLCQSELDVSHLIHKLWVTWADLQLDFESLLLCKRKVDQALHLLARQRRIRSRTKGNDLDDHRPTGLPLT